MHGIGVGMGRVDVSLGWSIGQLPPGVTGPSVHMQLEGCPVGDYLYTIELTVYRKAINLKEVN